MAKTYLRHSTEMAHMAGIIAEEIGADVTDNKVCYFNSRYWQGFVP